MYIGKFIMSKKIYDYEYVKQCFENIEYTLLSTTYKSTSEKLDYICNNGHKRNIRFICFKKGQRCKLCVKHTNQYTKDDIKYLINNYPKLGRKKCAELLKRTESSIAKMVSHLKLKMYTKCPVDSINNKICNKCRKELPKTEFGNDKRRSDNKTFSCKSCNKLYRMNRSDEVKQKQSEYHKKWSKNRMLTNLNYKNSRRLRKRMHDVINKKTGLDKTEKILGCSVSFFNQYIESKFQKGMTWENYGLHGWHFDHIKPCASFDLSKNEEIYKCFHYTNYQPLWCEDNWSKWAN